MIRELSSAPVRQRPTAATRSRRLYYIPGIRDFKFSDTRARTWIPPMINIARYRWLLNWNNPDRLELFWSLLQWCDGMKWRDCWMLILDFLLPLVLLGRSCRDETPILRGVLNILQYYGRSTWYWNKAGWYTDNGMHSRDGISKVCYTHPIATKKWSASERIQIYPWSISTRGDTMPGQ